MSSLISSNCRVEVRPFSERCFERDVIYAILSVVCKVIQLIMQRFIGTDRWRHFPYWAKYTLCVYTWSSARMGVKFCLAFSFWNFTFVIMARYLF